MMSSIGKFNELPRELRDSIWEHFVPQKDDPPHHLGILRTCRQMNKEVSPYLYGNQVLQFDLSPTYEYGKWFEVSTELGAVWQLSSLEDALHRGFHLARFNNFRALRINIMAPNDDDPGQLLCLWKKFRQLIELFNRSSTTDLSKIEVHFLEVGDGIWAWNEDEMQRSESLTTSPAFMTQGPKHPAHLGDFEVIATQLFMLQHRAEISMNLCECLTEVLSKRTLAKIKRIFDDIIVVTALPLVKDHTLDKLDDDRYWGTLSVEKRALQYAQEFESAWLINRNFEHMLSFDWELDYTRGYTADMMRLERFSSWFDSQEDFVSGNSTYLKIIKQAFLKTRGLEGHTVRQEYKARYEILLALNPLSAPMQKARKYMKGQDMPDNASRLWKMVEHWSNEDWCHFDIKVLDTEEDWRIEYRDRCVAEGFSIWEAEWLSWEEGGAHRFSGWESEWVAHMVEKEQISAEYGEWLIKLPTRIIPKDDKPADDMEFTSNTRSKDRWSRAEWHLFYSHGIPIIRPHGWTQPILEWMGDDDCDKRCSGGWRFEDQFETQEEYLERWKHQREIRQSSSS